MWKCGKLLESTEPVGKMLENVFIFFNIFSIGGVSSFPHFHMVQVLIKESDPSILL